MAAVALASLASKSIPAPVHSYLTADIFFNREYRTLNDISHRKNSQTIAINQTIYIYI